MIARYIFARRATLWLAFSFVEQSRLMHRFVSDLLHLLLQQSRHGSHHVSVYRISVHLEQPERILLVIEQLPLSILATLSWAFDTKPLPVSVYDFTPLGWAAVLGIRPVGDIAVHPVTKVCGPAS
jgi:hypothetical protein